MKKIIALALSALMLIGLFAGCGKDDGPVSDGSVPEVTKTEKAGSLIVNAAGIMKLTYGTDGLVLEVEGLNDDGTELIASYESMLGSDCAEVIDQFIKDCVRKNYMFNTNYVAIKLDKGSALPGTNFLENIKTAAENAIKTLESTAALVVITEEDLDENGYIKPAAAKVLAQAYLGVEKLDMFDGPDAPTEGLYTFRVGYNAIEDCLEIDALTAAVSQGVVVEEAPEEDEVGHVDPNVPEETTATDDEAVDLPADTTPAA